MTDVLIRIEMPKTCADCHDADLPTAIAWLGAKCPWANGIIDPGVYDLRHDRHPNCPLQELPEHGDLIDRDANADVIRKVMKASEGIERHMAEATLKVLNAAPVIVPASKEVTE